MELEQSQKEIGIFEIPQVKDIFKEPLHKWQKNYQFYQSDEKIPILIDYGSGFTKAGWGCINEVQVCFRSLVSKNKEQKGSQNIAQIGVKQRDIDFFKGNFRSPYERNIVQHFGIFESINDFIFDQLGLEEKKHLVMLTEPLANPEYCRNNLYEQLFECYGCPKIFLGVDCLFGAYYHSKDLDEYQTRTRLVINIGYSTIHIVPIIKGKIIFDRIKRVNVGVGNCWEVLHRSLHLKYPHLKQYFDYFKTHSILMNMCEVAQNYLEQLTYFKEILFGKQIKSKNVYKNKIQWENDKLDEDKEKDFIKKIRIQFPVEQIQLNESDIERKKELRQKASERLREAVAKKKEEKTEKNKKELEELENVLETAKSDVLMAKIQIEQIFGNQQNFSLDDVRQRIKKLKINLGLLNKEVLDEERYYLINVPDSELTADQKKLKRQQITIKAATEARAEKKKEEREKKEEFRKWKEDNPEKYLDGLYEKRSKMVKKLELRKKQKQELSQRNSKLNQKRMQTLAQLGAEENKKLNKQDDNFGEDDEDWNVYRGISKEANSDDENYEMKLNELDLEIREIDPDFEDKVQQRQRNPYGLLMNENFVDIDVDLVRGPECLFQPGICGIDQSGFTDTLIYLLKQFSKEDQKDMLENILLLGGGSQLKGIEKRIKIELIKEFEESWIQIQKSEDGIYDAWNGMCKLYKNEPQLIENLSYTSQQYYEAGENHHVIKQNPFSNIYIKREVQIQPQGKNQKNIQVIEEISQPEQQKMEIEENYSKQ